MNRSGDSLSVLDVTVDLYRPGQATRILCYMYYHVTLMIWPSVRAYSSAHDCMGLFSPCKLMHKDLADIIIIIILSYIPYFQGVACITCTSVYYISCTTAPQWTFHRLATKNTLKVTNVKLHVLDSQQVQLTVYRLHVDKDNPIQSVTSLLHKAWL